MFHVKHFRYIHSFTRLHSFGNSASLVHRLLTRALFRFGLVSHFVQCSFGSLPFCPMAKCRKHTSPLADLLCSLAADKARLQASHFTPFPPQPPLHRALDRRLFTPFSSIPSFAPPHSFVHCATVFHVKH